MNRRAIDVQLTDAQRRLTRQAFALYCGEEDVSDIDVISLLKRLRESSFSLTKREAEHLIAAIETDAPTRSETSGDREAAIEARVFAAAAYAIGKAVGA